MIIDPLWGEPALAAMRAAARGARHVQIGHSAGPTIELPASVVRAARMQILGFAVTDIPLDVRREAYRTLTGQAARGAISVDTVRLPLADVAQAWERQAKSPPAKQVLMPSHRADQRRHRESRHCRSNAE